MMREVPVAERKIRTLLQQLQNQTSREEAERWVELIRTAFVTPQSGGGMRDWCQMHTGQNIEALQANYDPEGNLRSVKVEARRKMQSNPIGVRFYSDEDQESGDVRYYGIVTLATTEDTYVGYHDGFLKIVVYHPVDDQRTV